MQQLYLTYAESRRLYGRETLSPAIALPARDSRRIFTGSQNARQRSVVRLPPVRPKPASLQSTGTYKLGQRVSHDKFGEGVVLQMEGYGAQERVQINFKQAGVKWLMLAYANLDILEE